KGSGKSAREPSQGVSSILSIHYCHRSETILPIIISKENSRAHTTDKGNHQRSRPTASNLLPENTCK
ncbi:unnamed protein product, partial [Allacma fusca]